MTLNPNDGQFFRFLSELPAAEIRHRLETYTSFMFVRHPLERLVSGFRDQFRASFSNRPFAIKSAVEIKAHYQGREPWEVAREGHPGPVTFEQFARWVADAPPADPDVMYPPGPSDIHWRPMSDLCHPCAIPYTFLGKFETMEEDAKLLLNLANVSFSRLPKLYSHSSTKDVTGSMVSSLVPETLRRVLQHYLQDFALFGYRPGTVLSDSRTALHNIEASFEKRLSEI